MSRDDREIPSLRNNLDYDLFIDDNGVFDYLYYSRYIRHVEGREIGIERAKSEYLAHLPQDGTWAVQTELHSDLYSLVPEIGKLILRLAEKQLIVEGLVEISNKSVRKLGGPKQLIIEYQ